MAVPKKRMSKSRKRMRRSHDALSALNQSACPQCTAPRQSHRICPECGHYNGRQIFEVVKEDEV